jgi:hypothetical protein
MKRYRSLLKATVLEQSWKGRTSQEIAATFQRRHARAIVPVAPALVTAKIIKDIDDVTHVGRKSKDPRQGELFEEYKFATVIPFPVKRDGKKTRIERRNLAVLTLGELTQWIADRKARPPRRSAPLDGYIALRDGIAPYASSDDVIVEVAYRAMKKAKKGP